MLLLQERLVRKWKITAPTTSRVWRLSNDRHRKSLVSNSRTNTSNYFSTFLKKWANPVLVCVHFPSFLIPFLMNNNLNNVNWNKHRYCAWDLNPGPQDGRRWRFHSCDPCYFLLTARAVNNGKKVCSMGPLLVDSLAFSFDDSSSELVQELTSMMLLSSNPTFKQIYSTFYE